MVVGLDIVASLFNRPGIRMIRVALPLAAYVIVIVLFSKLGFWPALALWWGIGVVTGLIRWRYEDVKPPSLVTVVRGLFVWPITVPLMLLFVFCGLVVYGLFSFCYILYKKLLPNHVPHYRGIEGCKEAAISGDARAQFTLGNAYERGDYGLPLDYAEAAKWYRKAAEQNHHNAQLSLGGCLAEGKGVEKNLVQGLMWIHLAHHVSIKNGAGYFFRDAAYQASRRTKAQMTEQQIAEAYVLLDSWPMYTEFKERLPGFYRELARSESQLAPEKSPPAAPPLSSQ